MSKFLNKLKSEKGAMDKVIVTLLLIVVALAALVSLEQWTSSQRSDLLDKSNSAISDVAKE